MKVIQYVYDEKTISTNQTQVQELTNAYADSRDGPTRTRYQAVRLYGTGYPTQEAVEITGCTLSSLMNWCHAYRNDGIEGLIDKRRGGNRVKLSQTQVDELQDRLQVYTPADLFGAASVVEGGHFWTVPDLQRAIEQWYSVSYRNPSSYHRLFDLCGLGQSNRSTLLSYERGKMGQEVVKEPPRDATGAALSIIGLAICQDALDTMGR